MKLQVKVGACTMRAAFSHIPFWQSTIWMGQQMVMQPCEGNIATGGSVVQQMEQVLPVACMFVYLTPLYASLFPPAQNRYHSCV